MSKRFNPRSRVGSDVSLKVDKPRPKLFQSTLPRGERRPQSFHLYIMPRFQSTLPRGERPKGFV